MRHQYLLIRRLRVYLARGMTRRDQPHLAQIVMQEGMGNCRPPQYGGCTKECKLARELLALTEPFMPTEQPAEAKPVKPLQLVTLKRPQRRELSSQPSLFGEAS